MARSFNSPMRILALAATLVMVSGCGRVFSSNCSRPAAYASAQSLPPLRIPLGLDAPDRRAALKIPDLNTPEIPREKGEPCLDQPPRYSNSARLTPAAPAKQ